MNLDQLEKAGGIVSGKPVKQPIIWRRRTNDGEEQELNFDIHVIRLAYGDYERLYLPLQKKPETTDPDAEELAPEYRSIQAELIALAVRLGEKADERLTYDMAYRLDPALGSAFLRAINIVNGRVKKKPEPDRGALARAGAQRDRGQDDRGSEGADVVSGVSAMVAVLPAAGND